MCTRSLVDLLDSLAPEQRRALIGAAHGCAQPVPEFLLALLETKATELLIQQNSMSRTMGTPLPAIRVPDPSITPPREVA